MSELPNKFKNFMEEHPAIANAYESLGTAVHAGGPLNDKTWSLIKLGISAGARLEGALHSHTRKALGDNVVTILNTVKSLTQPDMLHSINNAVKVYNKLDIEIEENVSYFQLFKRMNTQEMRNGIAFGIKFLKSLAEQQYTNQPTKQFNKAQSN